MRRITIRRTAVATYLRDIVPLTGPTDSRHYLSRLWEKDPCCADMTTFSAEDSKELIMNLLKACNKKATRGTERAISSQC